MITHRLLAHLIIVFGLMSSVALGNSCDMSPWLYNHYSDPDNPCGCAGTGSFLCSYVYDMTTDAGGNPNTRSGRMRFCATVAFPGPDNISYEFQVNDTVIFRYEGGRGTCLPLDRDPGGVCLKGGEDNRVIFRCLDCPGYVNMVIESDPVQLFAEGEEYRRLDAVLDPIEILPAPQHGPAPQTTLNGYHTVNCRGQEAPDLSFSTIRQDPSGGHEHIAEGNINSTGAFINNTLDILPDGNFHIHYRSGDFSGTEHLTTALICDPPCDPPVSVSCDLSVRVPNLVLLPENADYILIGCTDTHPGNHYVATSNLRDNLTRLAHDYHALFPNDPAVHYNDASLITGGGFEIGAIPWCVRCPNGCPHCQHRDGTRVDVRTVGCDPCNRCLNPNGNCDISRNCDARYDADLAVLPECALRCCNPPYPGPPRQQGCGRPGQNEAAGSCQCPFRGEFERLAQDNHCRVRVHAPPHHFHLECNP